MNNTLQAHDAPDVCDPAGYHIWRDDPVRFNDLDPHWHMTSISFMIIFESSRIHFVRPRVNWSTGPLPDGCW